MLKWLIAADSSCDLRNFNTGSENIGFITIPFLIRMDQTDYVDNLDLDVVDTVQKMEHAGKVCTACPSPELWADAFEKAENIIAITISGKLSGSYASAMLGRALALELHPNKNIRVFDSASTGPKLAMIIQAAVLQIKAKESFDAVCKVCENMVNTIKTVFALSNFANLVKNGRMPKIVGFAINQLGIRLVGHEREGEIHVLDFVRGDKKVLRSILAYMEKSGFNGVSATISHCLNEQFALQLRDMIMEKWKGAVVQVLSMRGLDGFYAERYGLIVGYQTA